VYANAPDVCLTRHKVGSRSVRTPTATRSGANGRTAAGRSRRARLKPVADPLDDVPERRTCVSLRGRNGFIARGNDGIDLCLIEVDGREDDARDVIHAGTITSMARLRWCDDFRSSTLSWPRSLPASSADGSRRAGRFPPYVFPPAAENVTANVTIPAAPRSRQGLSIGHRAHRHSE
jgi:hypothetical protein